MQSRGGQPRRGLCPSLLSSEKNKCTLIFKNTVLVEKGTKGSKCRNIWKPIEKYVHFPKSPEPEGKQESIQKRSEKRACTGSKAMQVKENPNTYEASARVIKVGKGFRFKFPRRNGYKVNI